MLEHGIVPASAGGYEIANSLRFNDNDSSNLRRTFSGGNTQKWTLSVWLKRSEINGGGNGWMSYSNTGTDINIFYFDATDFIWLREYNNWQLKTTRLFRDASAWYHIVIAYDSTQATRFEQT